MIDKSKINTKKGKFYYHYDFVKMRTPNIGERKDTCAERLCDFLNKYQLSLKDFANLSGHYAEQYGTRVTQSDLSNYLYRGTQPKIDKLYAMSKTMGMSVDYLCGYGSNNRRSSNPWVESRYIRPKR